MYRNFYTWDFNRLVLDSVPIMIWFKDDKNNILFANKTACDLTKMNFKEVEGKTAWELYPECADKYFEDDLEVIKSGEPKLKIIEHLPIKDGEFIWVSTDKVPYRDKKGNIIGVVVAATNVNDEKIYQDKLFDTAKKLEATNDQLKQFAYIASHDLKEPVRVIYNYSQLLMREFNGKLLDKEKLYFEYIVDAAERMKKMVGNLLEISQLGQPVEMENVDLNEVMIDVMKVLSLAIEESGAEIAYENLPVISGNYTQMIRLFQNLILNSIKFRDVSKTPKIHIDSEVKEDEVVLTISDNGIGIDDQFHDVIFYVFKRLHKDKKYPGTGIGLSICKKIVENHNGKIWVESVVDQGSKFFVSFPNVTQK